MGSISEFIQARKADLRRIAAATWGDMTIEDVTQEAWLVAVQIGKRRGDPIDFADAADQTSVVKWLYSKLVKFTEKPERGSGTVGRGGLRINLA